MERTSRQRGTGEMSESTEIAARSAITSLGDLASETNWSVQHFAHLGAWGFDTHDENRIFYLRPRSEDRWAVLSMDRNHDAEIEECSAPQLSDIVIYLTEAIMQGVRSRRREGLALPVPVPVTPDRAAPGFAVTRNDSGTGWVLHHTETRREWSGHPASLVGLSYYIDARRDAVEASLRRADGRPLFPYIV